MNLRNEHKINEWIIQLPQGHANCFVLCLLLLKGMEYGNAGNIASKFV